jgi:hypothetical protein
VASGLDRIFVLVSRHPCRRFVRFRSPENEDSAYLQGE